MRDSRRGSRSAAKSTTAKLPSKRRGASCAKRPGSRVASSFSPRPAPERPEGFLAYEEHLAGSKGRHLNFCFVADVETRDLRPNHEFTEWRWVTEPPPEAPENVRELVARLLASPRQLAQRWVEAFNARDLDRLLSLYAADAVHHSPKLRERQPETLGRITGKAELRAWWGDSFDRLIGLSYEPIAITADGERAILEYWRKLPGTADLRVAELFRCRAGRNRGVVRVPRVSLRLRRGCRALRQLCVLSPSDGTAASVGRYPAA